MGFEPTTSSLGTKFFRPAEKSPKRIATNNLCRYRTGRRKDQTPYGLLGLKLPDLSSWDFLMLTPVELRNQLSAMDVAA
ncbi:MAG: hypothetical protein JO284_10390 [Planctomycetaceae bacterium]|nr:hypothetical protein [Planctomycetaceae bacterium]MBV8316638.1 hypothetical protein [Planctomycetaceae bacterium]